MPASTLDPVNAALRTALSSKNNCNSNNCNTLDSQLAGSTKKALLSNIEFEPAGSYQSSVLDKLKSKYIVLKSSEPLEQSKKQNNKSETMGGDEGLTVAKCELYPIKAVQLGWNNADWSVGAGMVNMGNTCYLNSTLQALFHVPALVNWLISEKQHMAECEDSGGTLCIICAMRKTLQDSQQRNINSIRPYLIYNKLRVLCRNLLPGRQEDAHEFLRYLVEAMEKAYLHRFKNHSQFDSRTKETTPLNQILGGYFRSAVRCLECGNVSTTFQHFQDVLLDIRKAQTVDEALDLYFSKEKLDDDSYHCEKCQKKVTAWKQFSLERAPMVLCIQLKRFSISNNKITKHIQFRQRLDMTKYVRRRPTSPLVYRLVALVTHMGPTVNCGHYTAIAQAPSGNFYQFDDSIVKPISHQAVFGTMAYIMLYELENASFAQTNGKVKLPSTISSVTQLDIEETQPTTPQVNGELKVYGPALPPTPKFQKLPPITQNGTFTINGSNGDHSLDTFTSNENSIEPVLKEKHVQKENKPLPSSTLTSTPLPSSSSSSSIITKSSTETNMNGEVKSPKNPLTIKVQNNCSISSSPSKLPSKSFISSNTINDLHHNSQHEESATNSVQTTPTKLVPYDMDDSSNCSDESHNNSGTESTSSRIPTKAALGDWKVSSSIDISPEPSSQGNTWDKKKSSTVNELLKMSHSGYAAPVTSWNGTRSLLDKEVNNERREERKRALTDNLDQGRIKHAKLTPPPTSSNGSHNNTTTSNYNPIQEYHNSKNWNNTNNGQQQQQQQQQRYRSFYNVGKRHRNDRHNYHHKNNYHNKNHRFRH